MTKTAQAPEDSQSESSREDFNIMTKTAKNLLWDKEFVEGRIKEQDEEVKRIKVLYGHDLERERILNISASATRLRFIRQLENINKLQ